MIQKHYSNGKFLLTGEYLVLKGALAMALPLKLGQSLEVEELDSSNNRLLWEAFRPEGEWFSVTLHHETLEIIDCNDQPKAEKLTQILKAVKQLKRPYVMLNIIRISGESSLYYHLSAS